MRFLPVCGFSLLSGVLFMRYAVIADIHSNIDALLAVLRAIDGLKADRVVSLGDIVGYNASPNECVTVARERGFNSILGNHDAAVCRLEDTWSFNFQAETVIHWTSGVITEVNRQYLLTLPRSLVVDGLFLAVHGRINDTDGYITGERSATENFALLKAEGPVRICFFGHTHEGAVYTEDRGSVTGRKDCRGEVKLLKGAHYLINPGSVGQPRDRDPRASFLIYDAKRSTVNFHRVDYDIDAAAEKIRGNGLPTRLAERLKLGW